MPAHNDGCDQVLQHAVYGGHFLIKCFEGCNRMNS